MSKLIKVYGERNTNTNYISKLLELNLNVNEVSGTVPILIRRILDRVHYSNYYRDFNLSERWRHDLSDEAIEAINESVDQDLMAHFGYQVLPCP